MKSPINHTMVKMDDVLQVLNDLKNCLRKSNGFPSPESVMIDDAMKRIRSLETRKRLVLIEGGRK